MEKYFEYLDTLQKTGVTNMYGARSWLLNAFPKLSKQEAKDVLHKWMATYEVRHPDA